MTSWIVKIGKQYPEHWGFARDDGFWDVRHPGYFRRISPGDDVYFWLSGTGLVSWVRATTELYELKPTSPRAHWTDVDSGGYTHRFEFTTLSKDRPRSPTWNDLREKDGHSHAAQAPANEVRTPATESWLRSLFGSRR